MTMTDITNFVILFHFIIICALLIVGVTDVVIDIVKAIRYVVKAIVKKVNEKH